MIYVEDKQRVNPIVCLGAVQNYSYPMLRKNNENKVHFSLSATT